MQITIHLNTDENDDLTALIALIGAVGGNRDLPMPRASVGPVHVAVPVADQGGAAVQTQPSQAVADSPVMPEVAASTTTGGETDVRGLPWDERIHSSSREKNKDGTWRQRRGVDAGLVDTVTAELTAELSGNAAPPAPDAPAPVPAAPEAPAAPANPTPPPSPEPLPPAAPPAPPAPAPTESSTPAATPAADGPMTYAIFVGKVAKTNTSYVALNELAGTIGVPDFKTMKEHPDKWEMFLGLVGA